MTLILQTGSQIVGTANGGAGTNTVTLQGTGTASNAFTNFQSLTMAGTDWTWAGTGTFSTALVQSGTLNLTGTLGTTTASVVATVNAGATLQANAANLPLSVTDNGLVRFQQDSAGTYTGTISGSGAVEKTGAGTLTVAPSAAGGNTYSGGTTITQGTLSIAADNALGASSGNLTLNGGTLQLGSSFNLASSRAVAITANNGTIDTQSFNSTIAQNISGAGSLTKLGSGTLTLNGTNGYTGGTNVNAGTLVVGDGSNSLAALAGGGLVTVASGATLGGYGSVTGDVTNNGTISVANALASLASGPTGNLLVKGTLTNAGLVQLGGSGVGNMLTVAGNYVGQNATIALNTTLAGDGAPSDKLIVSGGAASGTSTLKVTNVGGAGARTVTDGIRVVQAINGATTRAGAFSLSGGSVSAGAYTYFLAKGGEATGTGDSWYLRNTVPPKPQPPVVAPVSRRRRPSRRSRRPRARRNRSSKPSTTRERAAILSRSTAPKCRYTRKRPLSRASSGCCRSIRSTTGRANRGYWPRTVRSRIVGTRMGRPQRHQAEGRRDPVVRRHGMGMQVGQDLYADTTASGHRNHYGFFLGFSRAVGDVKGFALAQRTWASVRCRSTHTTSAATGRTSARAAGTPMRC